MKLKDYTDPEVNASFTDEDIVKALGEGITVDGKSRMKSFGDKLTEAEITDLVAFVRALKKEA